LSASHLPNITSANNGKKIAEDRPGLAVRKTPAGRSHPQKTPQETLRRLHFYVPETLSQLNQIANEL
jgi:hypothetical protein